VLFRAVALNEYGDIFAADISGALAQFKQQDVVNINEVSVANDVSDWASAQAIFEQKLISSLYPHYPTTRKLAERLKVSHNKIAMKLRQFGIKS